MQKIYGSRLLMLAAELLEKQLDGDKIELTELAKNTLSGDGQRELRETLANRELAEFIELFENRDKIACLITLDMGCGNCSMARWVPDGANPEQIQLIELDTGELDENGGAIRDISVKSIIGYNNPDDYTIGERAVHGTSAVAQNFKRMPEPSYSEEIPNALQVPVLSYTDDALEAQEHTLEKVWGDFLEKIVDAGIAGVQRLQLLEDEINRENVLLVVAHPSSEEWGRAEVLDLFRNMISRHTGIPRSRILTFSESKAAMQFFRHRDKMKTLDFDKGVLIIDVGASTVDVEYLSGETKDPDEYSLTMAGRNADWVLGRDLLKQRFGEEVLAGCPMDALPDDAFFAERGGMLGTKAQFEFFARTVKENVSNARKTGLDEDAMLTMHSREDETDYGYSLSIEYLKQLLGTKPIRTDYPTNIADYCHKQRDDAGNRGLVTSISQSWYDHLETLLRFVLDALKKDGKRLGYILVTGGSSNLPGVEEVIRRAMKGSGLGEQDVSIHTFKDEADYERCVPVGSCRYVKGVWSNLDRMKAFEEALPDTICEDLRHHHEDIDRVIADAVIDQFRQALNGWAALERGNKYSVLSKLNKDVPETSFNELREKVYANIAQIDLDSVISEGIAKMRQNANRHMVQTMYEVNDLLADLANTDYKAQVPVDLRGIVLDRQEILDYLGGFIEANYLQAFEDYAPEGEKTFILFHPLDVDDQLSDKLRRSVAEGFLNENTEEGREHCDQIRAEISKRVERAIENATIDHGDFGISDRLLEDLVDHIKTALYLVKL